MTINFCDTECLKHLALFDFLDVCLLGETGTGKTYAARQIHDMSRRAESPFVAVNCAELNASIIESELFGYEKGAFTGAVSTKVGKFEAASGGTIFLDEIAELPSHLQAKLLKVVEEKSVTRVGSTCSRRVEVRIVYATNRDLSVLREDLRYRVAAHTIRLKPLRERREQILPLASLFINDFIRKSGRKIIASESALRHLADAEWRGNARELRSFLETVCLDALFLADRQNSPNFHGVETAELTAELLLSRLPRRCETPQTVDEKWEKTVFAADYRQERNDYDRRLIKTMLEKNKRNVSRTAIELGLSRYGLIKKIKRLGIIVAA